VQNCWQGFFFYQQSINVSILDCYAQLTTGGTLITAGSSGLTYSTGVSVQGTPEVEGLHIQGGSYYGYSYDFFLNLVFECQITAVDISAASVCPIFFTSVLGPLIIRDCWIELGAGASGTWNDKVTLGDGNLTGIFITAITPSIYNKVSIENNYIIADQPPACPAGSTGLYLGNSNVGLTVRSNHILGWDVGIGGGNTLTNVGGFLTAAVIKWNTINIVENTTTTGVYSASSAAILLNGGSIDCEVGPNYIVTGTGAAATASVGTAITVPNQSTGGNQQFPVNSPVQCTVSAAGFTAGVTYWVLTSATTTVTLAATLGGAAIAGTAATSIGSLIQAPLALNGGPFTGTTIFARGKSQLTLSDPAVSFVVDWVISGKIVSLAPESIPTGAGTTTTMTINGLPVICAPAIGKGFLFQAENATTWAYGYGVVAASGVMTMYPTAAAGAWTASGTKGLGQSAMMWQL
jgi:hypothetical protein